MGHFWTLAGKSSKMAHPAFGISTLAKLRSVSQSALNKTSFSNKQVSFVSKKQDDSLVVETSGPSKLRNGTLLENPPKWPILPSIISTLAKLSPVSHSILIETSFDINNFF
jgi:hypothetical protein